MKTMSSNIVSLPPVAVLPDTDSELRALFDQHFAIELALSPGLVDEVLALRYQVYCHERPFEDASCFPDGLERDGYDHRSAHALVRHRTSNECVAAVRLVLSDGDDPCAPFPVEAHCGAALPQTAMPLLTDTPRTQVAEISRLAVSREMRQRMGRAPQSNGACQLRQAMHHSEQRIMPYIAVGLFAAVVLMSAKLGITHWLAVMEPTLLRLLKRYGIHFPHVGQTVDYHGRRKPVFAQASALIDRIEATRPDVWDLMTQAGAILPARPTTASASYFDAVAGTHGGQRTGAMVLVAG